MVPGCSPCGLSLGSLEDISPAQIHYAKINSIVVFFPSFVFIYSPNKTSIDFILVFLYPTLFYLLFCLSSTFLFACLFSVFLLCLLLCLSSTIFYYLLLFSLLVFYYIFFSLFFLFFSVLLFCNF